MGGPGRRYHDEVPAGVARRVATVCRALPDAHEEAAWVGTRWRIRTRTFAHVLGIDDPTVDGSVLLAFRSAGEELEVLRQVGHPFVFLSWGRQALGLVLDDDTDWDEVRELVVESYCLLAPKKLAALVDRPREDDSPLR